MYAHFFILHYELFTLYIIKNAAMTIREQKWFYTWQGYL